jgi:hypothetical protein
LPVDTATIIVQRYSMDVDFALLQIDRGEDGRPPRS